MWTTSSSWLILVQSRSIWCPNLHWFRVEGSTRKWCHQFPPRKPLPNDDRDTPYFIIGDDAFSLRTWMMKSYGRCGLPVPERIFNYQLSMARRIVKNAFGILSNRFGCLLTTLKQEPLVVKDVIMSCICLHNLMRIRYLALKTAALDGEDDHLNLIPTDWRNGTNARCGEHRCWKQDNTSHQSAERIFEAHQPEVSHGNWIKSRTTHIHSCLLKGTQLLQKWVVHHE